MERDSIMQFFAWDHLPAHLVVVSKPFGELAERIHSELPRNAERSVALRKLLEAKDAAVRARLAEGPHHGFHAGQRVRLSIVGRVAERTGVVVSSRARPDDLVGAFSPRAAIAVRFDDQAADAPWVWLQLDHVEGRGERLVATVIAGSEGLALLRPEAA